MPGSRSRGDVLRSMLLVVAALVGLVVVRWSVTGTISRPIVAPASTAGPAPTAAAPGAALKAMAAAGTRLSLGGRQATVVDPADGSISRIAPFDDRVVSLFRQGSFTVLVSNGQAWAVPAGRTAPLRRLGRALQALPALASDRAWLVDTRDGSPE
jgi:hypothetical protein